MPNRTWIDFLSDVVAGQFTLQDERQPFAPAQREMLQRLLKESFTLFAEEMGSVVGKHITDLRAEVRQVKLDREHSSSCVSQGDVTPFVQATSPSKATLGRRLRRKRAKARHTYQKSVLLQLRPTMQIPSPNNDFTIPVTTTSATRCGQNTVTLSLERLTDHTGVTTLEGISACILKRQCDAVRTLQAWWRRSQLIVSPNILRLEAFAVCLDPAGKAAATLQLQNLSAIRIQRAWRNHHWSYASNYTDAPDTEILAEPLIGIPYLTLRDAITMTQVSIWHCGCFRTLIEATEGVEEEQETLGE